MSWLDKDVIDRVLDEIKPAAYVGSGFSYYIHTHTHIYRHRYIHITVIYLFSLDPESDVHALTSPSAV